MRACLLRSLLVASLTLVATSRTALGAEHVSARLTYVVAPDADECPDEIAFRTKVAGRLGYDPFTTRSTDAEAVSVRFTREATSLRARMELRASPRGEAAARELVGSLGHCETLASALANTVALALDPIAAAAPRAEAMPALLGLPGERTTPSITAQGSATPPPARSERPGAPIHGYVVVGGDALFGLVPGVGLGGHASVGLRYRAFVMEADGRVATSASVVGADARSRVEATALSGGISPCARWAWLSGCALFRAGVLEGRAPGVTDPNLGSSFIATLGVGVRAELPARRRVRARLELDAMMPAVRTELLINGQAAWTAPPIFVGLSLGGAADLW